MLLYFQDNTEPCVSHFLLTRTLCLSNNLSSFFYFILVLCEDLNFNFCLYKVYFRIAVKYLVVQCIPSLYFIAVSFTIYFLNRYNINLDAFFFYSALNNILLFTECISVYIKNITLFHCAKNCHQFVKYLFTYQFVTRPIIYGIYFRSYLMY